MRTTDRTRSTQKFPISSFWYCARPRIIRYGDAHADRATGERLHTEACRQPDMPERRFARVVLPTGIGDERDRSVERQRRCHPLVSPRLGKSRLRQQQPVEEEDADRR